MMEDRTPAVTIMRYSINGIDTYLSALPTAISCVLSSIIVQERAYMVAN